MRIHDYASKIVEGRAHVSATVTWEDCDWSEREIFFETDDRFSNDLNANPNAFLLAAFIPAMQFGEHRVLVEGHVCPQLRDGLDVVMQQLRKWYGSQSHPLTIESTSGFVPSALPSAPRTASCMSGGVDSLATLRRNQLNFPSSHPGAVKDLLFIYGFDLGGSQAWNGNLRSFELTKERFTIFAKDSDVVLIPIYTNIRFLEENSPGRYYTSLFVLQSFGACLAATAHALSHRTTSLLIPSSHDVNDLEPIGSHPLIDPNYSSSSLLVRHDGLAHSRMEKTRLLSEWEAGLQILRVCADPIRSPDRINCGRCEKCLRTMVSLLLLGKLEQCTSFEVNDVTSDDINSLWWSSAPTDASPFGYFSYGSHHFWQQLVEPLRDIGRLDLADVITAKIDEYHRFVARMRWKARVKRLDERFLQSTISRLWRAVRHRLPTH